MVRTLRQEVLKSFPSAFMCSFVICANVSKEGGE